MKLSERLARLVDVKSIVTIMLIGILCFVTVTGQETSELFNSSVMLVLGFFFGKNVKQEEQSKKETEVIDYGSSESNNEETTAEQ